MTIKYIHFPIQGPPKFTQIGIFGFKKTIWQPWPSLAGDSWFGCTQVLIRAARWFIFKPKIPLWVNLGGSCNGKCWYILWPLCLFYGHLAFLWSFGIFYGQWGMSKVLQTSNSTRGILIIELPAVSWGRKKNKSKYFFTPSLMSPSVK
jgi:hypothetical protein